MECRATAVGIEKVDFGHDMDRMKQKFKNLSQGEKERIFELIYKLRDLCGIEPL